VCEAVLHHVWRGGADASDPARLEELARELAPRVAPGDESIKRALKDSTETAIGLGIFGVPTVEVDGRLFWGLDSLDMLAGYLRGDPGSTPVPGRPRAPRDRQFSARPDTARPPPGSGAKCSAPAH